jgi:hypothetical protein
MVAVCASHITSNVRFEGLERMIHSWAVQELPVPLHVSLSFDSASFTAAEKADRQQAQQQKFLRLTVTLRDSRCWQPLSQGKHYKLMTQELAQQYDSKQTWLVFSDDDDIWHPQRTECYSKELLAASQALPNTLAVYSQIFTEEHNSFLAKHTLSNPWKLPVEPLECLTRGEYWSRCTRLRTAQQFFDGCMAEVLQHKYWDLCFVKFLRTGHNYSTIAFQPECWMYCYSRQYKGNITGGDIAARKAHMAAGNWGELEESHVQEDLGVLCAKHYVFTQKEYIAMKTQRFTHAGLQPPAFLLEIIRDKVKRAKQLLQEPDNIYRQLQNSPRCTESWHVL